MQKLLLLLVLAAAPTFVYAQQSPTVREYAYILKLSERLQSGNSWTEQDQQVVQEHFAHLQRLTQFGTVHLAGRSENLGPDALGIVIFSAESPEAAEEIMKSDPAVREGLMTATVTAWRTVLERKAQ